MHSKYSTLGAAILTVFMLGCAERPLITSHTGAKLKPSAKQKQTNHPKRAGFATLACQDITPKQTINITQPTQLSSGCQLTDVRFKLTQSGAALDCRGAELIGGDSGSAIDITSKSAITSIEVSNCTVLGYGHALHIHQKTPPRVRYLALKKQGDHIDPAKLRTKAPQHITINNLTSQNSKHSAVFIGDHVHHVLMDGLTIKNAGTVGVYFEFGSAYNVVKNSRFTGNGHRNFKPDREAIAIDSSSHNRIENNHFSGNGAGAVFLYRNCFEHASDISRSNHFLRTESSDHNVITGNTIAHENVGVWVASRQSRNLKGFNCGAYEIKSTPFARYHEDAAEHNHIFGNQFNRVARAVVVEDDNNAVTGNTFTQVGLPAVTIGSPIRSESKLGAVAGNKVSDNVIVDDCAHCDLSDAIDYVGDSKAKQQCGNRLTFSSKKANATEAACPVLK